MRKTSDDAHRAVFFDTFDLVARLGNNLGRGVVYVVVGILDPHVGILNEKSDLVSPTSGSMRRGLHARLFVLFQ